MTRKALWWLVALLGIGAQPLLASTSDMCERRRPLEGALAAWSRPVTLTAVSTAGEAPTATMALGEAARIVFQPEARLSFASAPGRASKPGSYGGLLRFEVRRAGTYRIALATPAWVEVIAEGKTIGSIAHGHGPACSGIAKIVDFALTPGSHVVQISGNATADTTAMIIGGS